jgi:hypothetical protein
VLSFVCSGELFVILDGKVVRMIELAGRIKDLMAKAAFFSLFD